MSKNEVEQLFAGLAAAGTTDASDLAFTLESAKAREKLQEFALAQPDYYQLLVVAGLYALGCRNFDLSCDADDFLLRAELSLPREPFCDLWSFVSRGSNESLVIGCRLLAMAILTSVRLDEMVWTLESRDQHGGWSQTITVRRGLLQESPPQPKDDAAEGVMLWAKRKAISQVVRRYLTRWWKGDSYPGSEVDLLRTRLFLPRGASLLYNGRPLHLHRSEPSPPESGSVWAVLETGQAPRLVESTVVHRFERDYSLAVLLCRPGSEQEVGLPGKAGHAVWIWNGLHMDATLLGADLTCMRAFIWAPELRPDLSLTSLVDNRDKQALERSVRSLARELLDTFVRALSEEMRSQSVPHSARFVDRLSIVKQALSHRVDPRKDWRRLASLNRALVECPLVVGSGADGRRRWYSVSELQREFLEGREIATFRSDQPPSQVPAWPERPIVLYTVESEWFFLNSFFRQGRWREGREVVEQIESLQSTRVTPLEPVSSKTPLLSGLVGVHGYQLAWYLCATALESPTASGLGSLQVRRPDGRVYSDSSLGLPLGFHASVEADWERSFHGVLLDRDLASAITCALLADLACEVAAHRSEPPSTKDEQLSSLVLSGLKEPLQDHGYRAPWLVITDLAGQRRSLSPQQLDEELQRQQAPLFFLDSAEALPLPAVAEWPELPLVVAPRCAQTALSALMGRSARSGLAFARLKRWTPKGLPLYQQALWSGRLDGEKARAISPRLCSLELTVLARKDKPHVSVGTNLITLLRGYEFQQRRTTGLYPSLHLVVDWNLGWPDANGHKMLGGLCDEEMSTLLSQACLALARELFLELASDPAGKELAARIPRKLLGTWMFDLLSDPANSELRLFLRADGRWVSLAEIHRYEGELHYLTTLAPEWDGSHPDAVFLPGPMVDTVSLFCDRPWNRLASNEPAEEPQSPPERDTSVAAAPTAIVTAPEPVPPPASRKPGATNAGATNAASMKPGPTNAASTKPAMLEPPSLQLASLRPEKETSAVAGPAFHSPGQSLVDEYLAVVGDSGSEFSEFAEHLIAHLLDERQPELFVWREQRLVLGAQAAALLPSKDGRLMLLSTLFSAVERRQSRYQAELVRRFHQLLLHRALG